MAPSDKVIRSFLYVPDKRVVLVLEDAKDALEASKSIKGAEIYANNQYVFLPTPHGLELVRGAKHGETAYGK
jgi:hypothetical protein